MGAGKRVIRIDHSTGIICLVEKTLLSSGLYDRWEKMDPKVREREERERERVRNPHCVDDP